MVVVPWKKTKPLYRREEEVPLDVFDFVGIYPNLVGPRLSRWITAVLKCRDESLILGAKQEEYIIGLHAELRNTQHQLTDIEMTHQIQARLLRGQGPGAGGAA